jgi:hypothetical protein
MTSMTLSGAVTKGVNRPVQCGGIVAQRGEGSGAATTCTPCSLRWRMTSFQLDPSGHAPWATTTVLFSRNGIFLLTKDALKESLNFGGNFIHVSF